MRTTRGTIVAALVVALLAGAPTVARAQYSPPAPPPPPGEVRAAIEALAGELASLGTALPPTSEHRVPLVAAASDVRFALGDTTGALAVAGALPPRLLGRVHRAPVCAMLERGDIDGALRYTERFTPRLRRDGAVAGIARAMAGRRYAADSLAPSAPRARRERALSLAETLPDPVLRLDAMAWVGVGVLHAGDTVTAREAMRRARAAWREVGDAAARVAGARDVAWLIATVSPSESEAWRRESGATWALPRSEEDSARISPPTAHDSAVARAGAGDVAGALRLASRVHDRYGTGIRAETLLEIASNVHWQAEQVGTPHPAASLDTAALVLRMAAREADAGRDSATRESLLRRVAEAQVGVGRYADALWTAERMRDWRARGAVAAGAQEFHVMIAEERANGAYAAFVRGLSDARSRDVVRLARVRAYRRFFGTWRRRDAAAIVDSLETPAMRAIGALALVPFDTGRVVDPLAVRAALLAVPDEWSAEATLAEVPTSPSLLPVLVEWVRATRDADARRERALEVAARVGSAWRWPVGRFESAGCLW